MRDFTAQDSKASSADLLRQIKQAQADGWEETRPPSGRAPQDERFDSVQADRIIGAFPSSTGVVLNDADQLTGIVSAVLTSTGSSAEVCKSPYDDITLLKGVALGTRGRNGTLIVRSFAPEDSAT